MNTWEIPILQMLNPYQCVGFKIEQTDRINIYKIQIILASIKDEKPVTLVDSFAYSELGLKYDSANAKMRALLTNIDYAMRAELGRQIDYLNKKSNSWFKISDFLVPNSKSKQIDDKKANLTLKRSDILSAATEWVFDTNGNKWSNNNSECGDNFGSFLEGVKFVSEKFGVKIIEDDSE